MSEHSRQLEDALDRMLEAAAVMRLTAFVLDDLPVSPGPRHDELIAAVGRAAEAGMRITYDAVELVERVSLAVREAA
ncbi:hypothetical protein QTA58_02460 [Neorhizobium sp. CSC1952]|uniref:hypothetical protein n=1 Tax=Neorhizobium sp. CSC1952 TaxID=2978974 RepID=UPI0025A566F1|nr:hypothetical protein [Rhizobium sp. CSC1952]WJR67647.1 hypothetical protein QTA58_02460 [Rhizobium sp. CSC1952]